MNSPSTELHLLVEWHMSERRLLKIKAALNVILRHCLEEQPISLALLSWRVCCFRRSFALSHDCRSASDKPHTLHLIILICLIFVCFSLSIKKLRKSYASGNFDSLARSLSQITSHSVFEESILSCAAHVFSAAVSHFSWKQTFLSPSHFAKNPPHYVQLCLLGDVMELLKAKELITSYDKHFNKK